MKTTLNEIRAHRPCAPVWDLLLKNLNKTKADNEPLSLIAILESNGLDDAIWALCCFDYLDYCLFLADIAESVLHIYEKNNDSKAPRLAIQAIRDYKKGKINKKQLLATADDVTTDTTVYADAAAVFAVYAVHATAAVYAVHAAAATDAAAFAVYAVADATAVYDVCAAADATRKAKNNEIKLLFIKHFGETACKQ